MTILFHSDLADRIILATALSFGSTLLARDRAILAWVSEQKNIRAIAV